MEILDLNPVQLIAGQELFRALEQIPKIFGNFEVSNLYPNPFLKPLPNLGWFWTGL